ncbi:MAG TPA: prepilin-type N-terminal cleavage/methylation domain-containing protein [Sumerlaeia bacterium]|nr:prepilin-type N-terminal cleavage/methylation domain-containing protein [Sumerlaeia bacterium]
MHRTVPQRAAFTLIELLIVVAIIAILAAIAVPNFLEAQARAKVAHSMAGMRSLATAVEAYMADCGQYPLYGHIRASGALQYPATDNIDGVNDQMSFIGSCVTTPVAYVTAFFEDPFAKKLAVAGSSATPEGDELIRKIEYINLDQHVANFGASLPAFAPELIPAWGHWRMVAAGPDGDRGQDIKLNKVYDATNGTVSDGDIVRCQRYSESRYNPEHPM